MSPPMQVETSSYAYDSATNKEMNKGLILRWKALAIAGISLSPPPPPQTHPPTHVKINVHKIIVTTHHFACVGHFPAQKTIFNP